MKRIITLLLAVAMLAGVVMLAVACGGNSDVTTTNGGKTTTTNGNSGGVTTTGNGGNATTTNGGSSGNVTTTGNSGGATTTSGGSEDPSDEWDGLTKLPGKEHVDFGGRTFFIASVDDGQGYDTTNEVWVESLTGNAYNDSVYERNKIMQELYNCTIKVDKNGQDGFAADKASGGGKYIASTSQYAGLSTPKGYYNIHSLGIDLQREWWDQNDIDNFT